MIDLRILGGMDLSATDGAARDPSGLLAQPKPTALFVYLLIARPGALLRRDTLAAMLWPESHQRRARGALSQTLYVIRRHLGPAVLITRGTEDIGIAADAVRCDALEFRRLLDEGRPEEALGLYAGELMPAFYLSDTPAFEHWLESERARLRRAAVEAAWAVADAAEAAGDAGKAVRWSRRAARMIPDDEAALRRMMETHDRLGDRSGALAEFERYRKRLMAELELEPESETSALGAAIASAGNRGEGPAVPVHQMAGSDERDSVERGASARRSRFSWPAAAWLAGLVVVVVLVVRLVGPFASPEGAGTIAMFPLRVVNTDSALQFLGEGISDLAALAFTGETGPRAVDMRLAMRAMEESKSLREAAERLGAVWYVDGYVMSTPRGLQLSPSLHETATGRIFEIPHFSAPVDSFQTLAQRMATTVMHLVTGQERQLVDYFVDASYPVTRHYVNGNAAYRRGDYYRAVQEFHEAVLLDPTIAPIKFGFLLATGWTGESSLGPPSRQLAWESRNELPARERDYVEALLGGPPTARFSGVTDPRRAVERWEAYVKRWPQDHDGWFELGDRYFHGGAMAGHVDYLDRAERAFRQALRLDPGLAQAYLHLIDVLVEEGVTPGSMGVAPGPLRDELLERARDYFTVLAPYARYHTAAAWRTAMALGDETWLRQIELRMDSLPHPERDRIIRSALAYGWPLDDAERAAGIQERKAVTADMWRTAIAERAYLDLNAGRPSRADSAAAEMHRRLADRPIHLFMRVEAALLGDGDESAAARAARELESIAATPASPDPVREHDRHVAGFLAETWKLVNGDTSTARRTIERIRSGFGEDAATDPRLPPMRDFATAYLEALLAAVEKQPDALRKAMTADSVLVRNWGETVGSWDMAWVLEGSGPVLMIRLHQIRGDDERALAAARRRGVMYTSAGSGTRFLSSRLLVEARLAARAGDVEGARRAYTHYLALRTDPEPSLSSQRDRAQAERNALPNR